MHQRKATSPPRTTHVDSDRFGALYAELAPDIFGFCYRRLNDADAANDATSRIFLKALNRLDSFRPDPTAPGVTFRAWIYRIARNDLIDHHRTAKPVESLDRTATSLSIIDPRRTPEDHALARDADRRVRLLLTRLPDSQRSIVELRLAGLSGDEIAETLGMTLSAVKSAQYRAYQTLRHLMRDDDPRAR